MTAQDVVNAILGVTKNVEVREAMLLGSYLESDWNQTAVGDQGTSFGPFQMHIGGTLTATGGSSADAENPVWSASQMESYYQDAVNQIPASTWKSNPEMAAEEAAVIAESPAESYYQSQGQAAVDNAWTATQNALQGIVSTSGSPGSTTSATTTSATSSGPLPQFPGGLLDPLNWGSDVFNSIFGSATNSIVGAAEGEVTKAFKDIEVKLRDWAIRLGLIILGLIVMYAGLTSFLKPSSNSTTNIVVEGAKQATKTVKARSGGLSSKSG
jgi:hypothetical protein